MINRKNRINSLKKLFKSLFIWVSRVLILIIIILILLVVLIQLPPIQSYITNNLEKALSARFQSQVEIGEISLNLNGDIVIKELLIEDPSGNPVLQTSLIDLRIALTPILFRQVIVHHFNTENTSLRLDIQKESGTTNLDFIFNAFSSPEPKRESSEPWKFNLKQIDVQNTKIFFHLIDRLQVIADIGRLKLLDEQSDLSAGRYVLKDVDLSNSKLSIKINDDLTIPQTSTENQEPIIEDDGTEIWTQVRMLNISNLNYHLNINEQYEISNNLGTFQGENLLFSLQEKLIEARRLSLQKSEFDISIFDKQNNSSNSQHDGTQKEKEGEFFLNELEWNIELKTGDIQGINIKFDGPEVSDSLRGFDLNNFRISDLNANIDDLILKKQHAQADIRNISFREHNGFDLQKFGLKISLLHDKASFESFHLETPFSRIRGDFKMHDIPMVAFPKRIEEMKLEVHLKEMIIAENDMRQFLPAELINEYKPGTVEVRLNAEGSLDEFTLELFEFSLDQAISVKASGKILELPDIKSVCLDPLKTEMTVESVFLEKIMNIPEDIRSGMPKEIELVSEINGCPDDMIITGKLISSLGELQLSAEYRDPGKPLMDSMLLTLQGKDVLIGKIFGIDSVGPVNFTSDTRIIGIKDSSLSVNTKISIQDLVVGQESLQHIRLSAGYYGESADIDIESQDSHLNLSFNGEGLRKDSIWSFDMSVNIEHADLHAFGLSDTSFYFSTVINSQVDLGKNFLDASVGINDLTVTSTNTFDHDSIEFRILKDNNTVAFYLQSPNLSGSFLSSIPLQDLPNRVMDFYRYHLLNEDSLTEHPENGTLEFSFTMEKPLDEMLLFVPDLEEFRFDELQGHIDESKGVSIFAISIPMLKYREIRLDSLTIGMSSNRDQLNYNFSVKDLKYRDFHANNLGLSGYNQEEIVNNVFRLQEFNMDTLLRIGFYIEQLNEDGLAFTLNPDSLIINSNIWTVNGENRILFGEGNTIGGKINISNEGQSLQLEGEDSLYNVHIRDFKLVNLSKILKYTMPDLSLDGVLDMNSNLVIDNQDLQISSDISVKDLSFQKTVLGNLKIKAGNKGDQNINVEMSLVNNKNELMLTGNYNLKDQADPVHADVIIQLGDLSAFHSFGNEFIADPEGKMEGRLSVKGRPNNLDMNGVIDMTSLRFLVSPINNLYEIQDETITVKNSRFEFDNFSLLDSAGNSFIIDGFIQGKEWDQIKMDLRMRADRFTVYNASQATNSDLYGKLIVSMKANIKGEIQDPNILVDLSIDPGTNLTYTLPPKNFDLISSEGVVEFVDFSESDSTGVIGFKQQIGDSLFSKLNWLDLNAVLNIDKRAQFTLDLDPFSGDYIRFGGEGALNVVIQKNQPPQLNGRYVFDRGIYEVSFYGMVRKTFSFQSGSVITWTGNPYNALLNLKANYEIRTASVGLVSREIYGMSDEEKSKYRRALPYSVEIGIRGKLDNPEIGFAIDLPPDEKSSYPLVESKLNQLREPGHESELTKQVFGLLTIGSFIPETTGPGGNSDFGSALASTAAANSLNSILTNELNKLSGRYIKFADLDFGMQTYSDMSGGGQSNRTTMDVRFSKKLFNDRVTVEAQGSFEVFGDGNKYNQMMGQSDVYSDFAIIYDLTKKGDYKVKAFERSAYDIIYKDTRMGGVAIIFIKEFDKYRRTGKTD